MDWPDWPFANTAYSIMLWEGHHSIARVVADGLAVVAHFTSYRKTRNMVEHKGIYEDILEYLAKELINKIVRDGRILFTSKYLLLVSKIWLWCTIYTAG